MDMHQQFLKFEAVLSYCETRVPSGEPKTAFDYGREMDFFDRYNSLTLSGLLLAELILPNNQRYIAA